MLTPDPDSRLSDGVVIETRLRARLFGATVLKIDGTVLVSPARLLVPTPPRIVRGDVVSAGCDLSGAASPKPVGTAPGAALAQATQLLKESGRRLGH